MDGAFSLVLVFSLVLAVLLFRVGMALYVIGLSRAKNSAGAAARNIAELAVGVLTAFVLGGITFAFAVNKWESTSDLIAHLIRRQFPGVAPLVILTPIATGIVIGPIAERSRFRLILATSACLGALIVPLLAVWSASSWLGRPTAATYPGEITGLGFVDHCGASWLHVAGGMIALVAAFQIKPRDGKYHRDGSASVIPGHNVPIAVVGSLLMTAGLLVLNALNSEPLPGVLNTLLAASAGATASLVYSQFRYGKPDIILLMSGLLAGAISTSAGSAMLPVFAILSGGVAGVIVPFATVEMDLRLRIDDPTGGISIHLLGGAWALLAAGIFSGNGVAGTFRAIGVQLLGLLVAVAVSGSVGFVLLKLLPGRLRPNESDEFDGLDLAEHDIGAYPDFQQNSIKSYHLREA